jgi:hypothetical protein
MTGLELRHWSETASERHFFSYFARHTEWTSERNLGPCCVVQAGQGLHSFVGSGELTWVNCVYGNTGITTSQVPTEYGIRVPAIDTLYIALYKIGVSIYSSLG